MYFFTVTIMVGIVLMGVLGMVLHARSSATIMADTIAWTRRDGRLIRKIPLA